jgi:hypothetical protein
MTRNEHVDRGAKAPPNSDKPNDKRTRAAGAKGPTAPSAWLKPVSSYDRQQGRVFQVTRFG